MVKWICNRVRVLSKEEADKLGRTPIRLALQTFIDLADWRRASGTPGEYVPTEWRIEAKKVERNPGYVPAV